MNKKDIAEFFDRCAPWWDADMIRPEEIITKILENAGIRPGIHVLDVACGTGVLFPDYLSRGANVTGIDISPEMVRIAREKFPDLQVLCGDVEALDDGYLYDAAMVYNAFPHFPDPAGLIRKLAALLKEGGRVSVAHSMSRAALADHHAGRAASVSVDLIHEQELAKLMEPWFEVDTVISDEHMYQVCGTRRPGSVESLSPNARALSETASLLRFMVRHNDAHAQELAELADRLKELGRDAAAARLMDAVADFDAANARIAAVLRELEREME